MADRDKISHLKGLISTDERFVGRNGRLLVNKVQASAKAYDPDLIRLLMGDERAREMFFVDIDGTTIFENDKFIWALEAQDYLEGSYTEYSQRIGLTVGGRRISDSDDVVLEFPYKDCVLEFDSTSEDDDRPEVMMNETLMRDEIDCLFAPKVFTDAQIHDSDGVRNVDHMPDDVNGLLVKGNNLLVLHSLLPRYKGKVKLMYWDILYNTGDDRVPYNDSFKHSTWLVMMKNRLEIAKQLLRDDGVICLQCDDTEQAYLKVLGDEVFGRDNYVNCISLKMKNVAGASGGGEDKRFKKNIEYLLIWAKHYQTFVPNPVFRYREVVSLVEEYRQLGKSWKYTNVLINSGTKKYVGTTYDGSGSPIRVYARHGAVIKSIAKVMKEEGLSEREAYEKYANQIFDTAMPQSSIRPRALELVESLGFESDIYSIEYVPNSGRHKDELYEQFYRGKKFRLFAWLKDTSEIVDGVLCKKERQGTYWDFTGDMNNVNKEGGKEISLGNGKKAESIIRKVIEAFSNEGDLVIDAYLGSGTTTAVCQKMGRNYIGIEQLDRHMNLALLRMDNVVHGDPSGISESVGWHGGGSFIYCSLLTASVDYIQRAKTATSDDELSTIFNELIDSPFVLYRIDLEKARDGFPDLSIEEKREAIVRVIDKNTLYVNYADIDDEDFVVSDEAQAFTRSFYTKGAK